MLFRRYKKKMKNYPLSREKKHKLRIGFFVANLLTKRHILHLIWDVLCISMKIKYQWYLLMFLHSCITV